MKKLSTLEQENLNAEFRCPFLQRMYGWFATFFLCLFAGGVISAVMWLGLPNNLWPKQTIPIWWHLISVLAILFSCFIILLWLSRKVPTRLIITTSHVLIGSIMIKRSISIEDIRLLKLSDEDSTMISALQVIIRFSKRGFAFIWLRPEEAKECFDTLHYLSNAPAMLLDEEIHAPINPEFESQAQTDIANEYNIQGKQFLYSAIGSLAFTGYSIYALVNSNKGFNNLGAWFWLVSGILAATVSIIFGLRYRANARAVEATEDFFKTEVECEKYNEDDCEEY